MFIAADEATPETNAGLLSPSVMATFRVFTSTNTSQSEPPSVDSSLSESQQTPDETPLSGAAKTAEQAEQKDRVTGEVQWPWEDAYLT